MLLFTTMSSAIATSSWGPGEAGAAGVLASLAG
jgi:hypothetical protein